MHLLLVAMPSQLGKIPSAIAYTSCSNKIISWKTRPSSGSTHVQCSLVRERQLFTTPWQARTTQEGRKTRDTAGSLLGQPKSSQCANKTAVCMHRTLSTHSYSCRKPQNLNSFDGAHTGIVQWDANVISYSPAQRFQLRPPSGRRRIPHRVLCVLFWQAGRSTDRTMPCTHCSSQAYAFRRHLAKTCERI